MILYLWKKVELYPVGIAPPPILAQIPSPLAKWHSNNQYVVCWVSMVNIPPPSSLSAAQHTIYPTLMSAPALPKWWAYGEADSYHFLRLCPSKPSKSRPSRQIVHHQDFFFSGVFSILAGIALIQGFHILWADGLLGYCKKACSVLTWEPLLYQRVDMICDECHSREIPGLWLTDNFYASTLLPLPVNIRWLHTAQT